MKKIKIRKALTAVNTLLLFFAPFCWIRFPCVGFWGETEPYED